MKIISNTKFLLSILFLILLTACNNNTEQGLNNRNLTGNELQEISNTNNTNVEQERGASLPAEIQRVHNGFLTIDQNSFSTSIPSQDFPHSELIEEGGRMIFQFGQNQGGSPQQGQDWTQGGLDRGGEQAAPQPNNQGETAQQPAPPPREETTQPPAAQNDEINDFEARVIELTNAERSKNGLSALKADNSLSNVAQEKSNDMEQNNYFSHTSPTYGSPFDMMRDFGVTYSTAGENIAMGQQTPEQVVDAWMNSEGHRKNILNGSYTHIGVGFTENGAYWTQMFVGR